MARLTVITERNTFKGYDRNWKGGTSYSFCHARARKLYLKDTCDICGINVNEKKSSQKLDMHCKGDWKNLRRKNWTCVCRACHKKEHFKMGSN